MIFATWIRSFGFSAAHFLIAAAVLFQTSSVRAGVPLPIYFDDFNGTSGLVNWKSDRDLGGSWIEQTPLGERNFLGRFSNDSVHLTLDGLGSVGQEITVSFQLYLILTWDGNGPTTGAVPAGPDVFQLDVSGGQTLLRTTFSNNTGYPPFDRQSYPAPYLQGDYPARTGASENNTLGYTYPQIVSSGVIVQPADSVYEFSFRFWHESDSITFNFSANGLEGLINETWGIDRITVAAVSSVPEPSIYLLLLVGAAFLKIFVRSGKAVGLFRPVFKNE